MDRTSRLGTHRRQPVPVLAAALTVAHDGADALPQGKGRVAGRHLLEGVVRAARKHFGQRVEAGGDRGGAPADAVAAAWRDMGSRAAAAVVR